MGLPDYRDPLAGKSIAQLFKPAEADPTGRNPHEAGAKVDAGKVEMSLILDGMPRALRAVAEVGTFGANKYTRDGWQEVPDGFRRYRNAQQRHANDFARGEVFDSDSKLLHLAHEAWNALAKLELFIREENAAGRQA